MLSALQFVAPAVLAALVITFLIDADGEVAIGVRRTRRPRGRWRNRLQDEKPHCDPSGGNDCLLGGASADLAAWSWKNLDLESSVPICRSSFCTPPKTKTGRREEHMD